jgi:hypothetical protein
MKRFTRQLTAEYQPNQQMTRLKTIHQESTMENQIVRKIGRAVASALIRLGALRRLSALAGIIVKLRNRFFPIVIATAPLRARLMI